MSCEIHKYHFPKPLSTEAHHVTPQAWQRVWCPETSLTYAGWLWDEHTVDLCPTGHRNVHRHLVKLMKTFEAAWDTRGTLDERGVLEATRLYVFGKRLSREEAIALLAPSRWLNAGGSLNVLTDKNQYGYGTTYATGGYVPS
jgi:hypothetical protein